MDPTTVPEWVPSEEVQLSHGRTVKVFALGGSPLADIETISIREAVERFSKAKELREEQGITDDDSTESEEPTERKMLRQWHYSVDLTCTVATLGQFSTKWASDKDRMLVYNKALDLAEVPQDGEVIE